MTFPARWASPGSSIADFVAVMARVDEACKRHNMPMGNHVVQPEPERLAKCIADGCRFIAYGIDAVFPPPPAAPARKR